MLNLKQDQSLISRCRRFVAEHGCFLDQMTLRRESLGPSSGRQMFQYAHV